MISNYPSKAKPDSTYELADESRSAPIFYGNRAEFSVRFAHDIRCQSHMNRQI